MRETTIYSELIRCSVLSLLKSALIASLLIGVSFTLDAQRPQYKITAALDTATHTLTGTIDIAYTNLSDKPLDRLGIHLWPNAYSNKNTAYAKQSLHLGNLEFQRARPSKLGGISGLHFFSKEEIIALDIDTPNIDMAWLTLNVPLQPGQTIQLSSPYTLKIPISFSRLGRTDESYQLTQWYPHIAVLDKEGWHRMLYLDEGEYFNDFADYEVTIETPPGYTVASTGTIVSIPGEKSTTWNCHAENVIDFAWFASPTFRHEIYLVDVGKDDPVELHLYIDSLGNQLWDSAGVYAQRALKYYSDWLGPYPYAKMSVVYTPLSNAGFMEYPMLAQISFIDQPEYLDGTIAHEIGHTWLYAILANDERSYSWMDEGLNTFIERQYTQEVYPGYEEPYFPEGFIGRSSMSDEDALEHIIRFENKLLPPATDARFLVGDQYLYTAYTLPSQGLEMMMSMYGRDTMQRMFRQYYNDHKFSHVTPTLLQQSFESACQCDLSWFFEDWIHHAHEVDYRIKKFDPKSREVIVANKGNASIPLKISTYNDEKMIKDSWVDGFEGQQTIKLDKGTDEVHLYEDFMGINKIWRGNVKPRSILPHISLLPKLGDYNKPTLSITPFFGYNISDGFMPGVAFNGGLLPQQRFKFVIAPMYGLESQQVRGHAEVRYIGDITSGPFDKFLLSFVLDDFGYNLDTDFLFRDHYVRWSPIAALRVDPDEMNPHITQWWQYRFVHIDQFYGRGLSVAEGTYVNAQRQYGIHELSYKRTSDKVAAPYTAEANVQTGNGFVRVNLNYKQHFTGKDIHHGIWVHGFGGWLPLHDLPTAYIPLLFNGSTSEGFFSKDYMFDEWLPGRNKADGIFGHQIFEKDANLKTLASNGISEQWMIGGGFSVALPFRFIHVYMDGAYYQDGITQKTVLSYSGGISIVAWKDIFEIYIPILESQDIKESIPYTARDVWYERITFQANFKLANPLNIVDHAQLGY